MSIIRGLGRVLFSSYFIVKGSNAALKPNDFVEEAEPVADKLVPMLQRTLPSVGGYIPDDTRALVRATGAAQAAGGLAMATGLGRRLGGRVGRRTAALKQFRVRRHSALSRRLVAVTDPTWCGHVWPGGGSQR